MVRQIILYDYNLHRDDIEFPMQQPFIKLRSEHLMFIVQRYIHNTKDYVIGAHIDEIRRICLN